MGGAVFTPRLGSWKFYNGTGWATQEAAITGVQNNQALRLRLCVHETGGKAGSNLDVQMVYSTSSDLSGAVTFGAPSDTDKVFRWRDDAGVTEHAAIVGTQLSCYTESGLSHEQTCVNSTDVGASAHNELEVIFEPYDLASSITYYFGLVLESATLAKDAEITVYPNLTSGSISTSHYQTVTDIAGLTDSVTKVQAAHKTVTDLAGLLDSAVAALATGQTVTDLAGLLDSISAAVGFTVTASDLTGLLDSVTLKQNFKGSALDIAGLLDSVGVVHTPSGGGTPNYETISDIAGLVDSITAVNYDGTPSAPTITAPSGYRPSRRIRRHRKVYALIKEYLELKRNVESD